MSPPKGEGGSLTSVTLKLRATPSSPRMRDTLSPKSFRCLNPLRNTTGACALPSSMVFPSASSPPGEGVISWLIISNAPWRSSRLVILNIVMAWSSCFVKLDNCVNAGLQSMNDPPIVATAIPTEHELKTHRYSLTTEEDGSLAIAATSALAEDTTFCDATCWIAAWWEELPAIRWTSWTSVAFSTSSRYTCCWSSRM